MSRTAIVSKDEAHCGAPTLGAGVAAGCLLCLNHWWDLKGFSWNDRPNLSWDSPRPQKLYIVGTGLLEATPSPKAD